MKKVTIRELMHNFSKYLKEVKEGDCITILERNQAVAEIIPHNPNIRYPGWKRAIEKRSIPGESLSESVVRNRAQDTLRHLSTHPLFLKNTLLKKMQMLLTQLFWRLLK